MRFATDPEATQVVPLRCPTCLGAKEKCDDCRETGLHGATFTMRRAPASIFRECALRIDAAASAGRRRVIKALKDAGEEPTEKTVEQALLRDTEYRRALDIECATLIRWTVRGHSGFAFADGRDVPFGSSKDTCLTWSYEVVDDATMRVYAADAGLFLALYLEARDFNTLTDLEKKVSPPGSSPG